mmetsp:Transcript_6668/g.11671  ORF Transcript_6668/g.11671 Transcript_6668/m.11671 type:complete len:228 (+) Transcript_6668:754-1437(+)
MEHAYLQTTVHSLEAVASRQIPKLQQASSCATNSAHGRPAHLNATSVAPILALNCMQADPSISVPKPYGAIDGGRQAMDAVRVQGDTSHPSHVAVKGGDTSEAFQIPEANCTVTRPAQGSLLLPIHSQALDYVDIASQCSQAGRGAEIPQANSSDVAGQHFLKIPVHAHALDVAHLIPKGLNTHLCIKVPETKSSIRGATDGTPRGPVNGNAVHAKQVPSHCAKVAL